MIGLLFFPNGPHSDCMPTLSPVLLTLDCFHPHFEIWGVSTSPKQAAFLGKGFGSIFSAANMTVRVLYVCRSAPCA